MIAILIGVFLALGAALFSSIGYISVKQGLETADYRIFITLSVSIGLSISGCLLWSTGIGLSGLSIKATLPFVVTGVLGGGLLTRISSTKAIDHIGASRTHALISVSPLVTALLGILMLEEVISLQLTMGMLIVVVGASFLSYLAYKRDSRISQMPKSHNILGLSLAFYSLTILGFQPVLRKVGLEFGASPLQGAFIRFAAGFICYIAYLLISRTVIKLKLDYETSYYLVASISWAIAPLLSIFAIQFISPTVFASLIRVGPLFTVILTYFFLKDTEKTSWRVGINALLIVIGAILVSTA